MDRTSGLFKLVGGSTLAVAYVALGKTSLLLAIPPGYVSPVFLPAGLAFAAVYLFGASMVPWVLFGSFTLNLLVPVDASGNELIRAALAIATASAAQAMFGAWLLRQVVGKHARLDRFRSVARYLFVVPLACTVSSSLSVAMLTFQGVFEPGFRTIYWFNWWIGDSLGVVLLFPILVSLFGEPSADWKARRLGIILPILLSLPVVVFGFVQSSKSEQQGVMGAFEVEVEQFFELVQSNLDQQMFMLEMLVEFLEHSGHERPLTLEEFRAYLEPVLVRHPMIKAVALAPRVELAERKGFLAEQRITHPDYDIHFLAESEEFRGVSDQPVYFPVTHVVPLSGHRQVLGFDLLSSPERKEALSHAITTRQAVASRQVNLVDQAGNQPGILLIKSVESGQHAHAAVISVINVNTYFEGLLGSYSDIRIRLTDWTADQEVYGSLQSVDASIVYSRPIAFGSRSYLLEAAPSHGFLHRHREFGSWWFMVAGTVAAGLLGAMMLLVTGYTARVERAVERRTEDLQKERDRSERLALQAEAASQAKSRFLSKVGHEMLTPLNGILGMIGLLRKSDQDERASLSLGMAESSARQLLGLVNETLEYSALEMDEAEPEQLVFSLAEVLRKFRESFGSEPVETPSRFAVYVDEEVPGRLVGDETRLLHVLRILGENAVKFSDPGTGIELSVIASRKNRDFLWLQFSLRDRGIGIEQENLERIFRPFEQGDDSLTRQYAGAGLGLSLARRIVDQMHGKIWADSVPGEGSTFHFTARFGVPSPAD